MGDCGLMSSINDYWMSEAEMERVAEALIKWVNLKGLE